MYIYTDVSHTNRYSDPYILLHAAQMLSRKKSIVRIYRQRNTVVEKILKLHILVHRPDWLEGIKNNRIRKNKSDICRFWMPPGENLAKLCIPPRKSKNDARRCISSPEGDIKAMPAKHTYIKFLHMMTTLKFKINMLRPYLELFICPLKPSAGLLNLVRLSI
jgi:hypothetical protein